MLGIYIHMGELDTVSIVVVEHEFQLPHSILFLGFIVEHFMKSQYARNSFNTKSIFFFLSFVFGPYLWHMEVPRLGVKSEL